jgi:hypothetical protein
MTPIEQMVQIIINLPLEMVRSAWNIINPILIENWDRILIAIVILLVVASIKFIFTRRWGTLGSLLYHIFFFGIMYFYFRAVGPEVILEDYFKYISFIIYIVGFFLTRFILKAFGVKNMPDFYY